MERDPLTEKSIGCAIEVHRTLGPGLLESVYLYALAHELKVHNIEYKMECPLLVDYKDVSLGCGYRIDLLVEDRVIVELKSVETLKRIHTAQTLTYMKLSGIGTGLLINFNVERLVDGIKRLKI